MRRAIEAEERLEVIGEANNGRSLLDLIRASEPDLALVDLRMPKLDGWGVLTELREAPLATKVVIVSAHEEPGIVRRALGMGAAGYVSKGTEADELRRLLLAASRGRWAVSAKLQPGVLERFDRPKSEDLSEREREVLVAVADGLSAKQIAERLHVAEATVRTHQAALRRKLGAANVAAAAVEAVRRGLID